MIKFIKDLWGRLKMEAPKIHREDQVYPCVDGEFISGNAYMSGIKIETLEKFAGTMAAPNMFGVDGECAGIRSMTMPCGRRIDFPAGFDFKIVSYAHASLVRSEAAKLLDNRDFEDAKRYRYMRNHGWPSMESWFDDLRSGRITKEQADAEIDLCIRNLDNR